MTNLEITADDIAQEHAEQVLVQVFIDDDSTDAHIARVLELVALGLDARAVAQVLNATHMGVN